MPQTTECALHLYRWLAGRGTIPRKGSRKMESVKSRPHGSITQMSLLFQKSLVVSKLMIASACDVGAYSARCVRLNAKFRKHGAGAAIWRPWDRRRVPQTSVGSISTTHTSVLWHLTFYDCNKTLSVPTITTSRQSTGREHDEQRAGVRIQR